MIKYGVIKRERVGGDVEYCPAFIIGEREEYHLFDVNPFALEQKTQEWTRGFTEERARQEIASETFVDC